jgi:hypothetical protein
MSINMPACGEHGTIQVILVSNPSEVFLIMGEVPAWMPVKRIDYFQGVKFNNMA